MSEATNPATISAEEALRRAKEIAARLSGQPLPSSSTHSLGESYGGGSGGAPDGDSEGAGGGPTTTAGSKRKRWGVAPPPEAQPTTSTTSTSPSASNAIVAAAAVRAAVEAAKRLKASPPSELSVQKRVWVSLDRDRPLSHFVSYLSRHLPLIADQVHTHLRGSGSTTAAVVGGSSNNNNQVKLVELSLQGRGASKEPPVPGMPEQPLHVLINGTKESTPVAAVWVEQALLDAQEAPLEGDGGEYDDLDSADAAGRLAITSSSASSSAEPHNQLALVEPPAQSSRRGGTYRPASVAQLIGVHSAVGGGSGAMGGPDPFAGGGPVIEEEMRVPHSVVGLIIGRGGEHIATLQARTGCRVQIQKESDLVPGQTHRVISLAAPNQESLDACRAQINRIVEERLGASATTSGGGGAGGASTSSSSKVQEAVAMGHVHLQVPVPEDDVGLIIGKQGMTIRSMQDQTGANIQVPPQSESTGGIRLVDVTHPTAAGAQAAKEHIEGLLRTKPRNTTNGGMGGGGGSPAAQSSTIQVAVRVAIRFAKPAVCCVFFLSTRLLALSVSLSLFVHPAYLTSPFCFFSDRSPTRTWGCALGGRAVSSDTCRTRRAPGSKSRRTRSQENRTALPPLSDHRMGVNRPNS